MRILEHFRQSRGYQLLAVGALLSLSLFTFMNHVGAASDDDQKGGRLVTFHDRGREKVVLTHAQTVKDALSAANISIAPQDQIEPTLDERLTAAHYTINIYRARPVIVTDGVIRQKIMTASQTAEGISKAAGLELHDEDDTELGVSANMVADGASVTLTIDRAIEFKLNLYGKLSTAYTQASTVGEMMKRKNILLGKDDDLSVGMGAPMTAGMTVSIWRNGVQAATIEEPIAFPVRQIQDADKPTSYKKIQTPGANGRKNVTYEIVMKNGKEVSRKVIQSVTLEEPKEQVEVVGVKPSFSGDFAAALAKLRACEAGGNYANKKNPRYRGAYQFSYATWANKYGIYDPADASPAQQDQAARELYVRRGWQPWPHCGSSLPDIYR